MNSFPGVRELVRLRPGEGDHHLALAHWILSSKSFAVKTLQKDEVDHDKCKYKNHGVFNRFLIRSRCAYPISTSMPNCVT